MSKIYTDLNTVLTPYATAIKKNASDITSLNGSLENLETITPAMKQALWKIIKISAYDGDTDYIDSVAHFKDVWNIEPTIKQLSQSDLRIGRGNSHAKPYSVNAPNRAIYGAFDIPTTSGKVYKIKIDWNDEYDLYAGVNIYTDTVFDDVQNQRTLTVADDSGWKRLEDVDGLIEIESTYNSAMRMYFKLGDNSNFDDQNTYINSIVIKEGEWE